MNICFCWLVFLDVLFSNVLYGVRYVWLVKLSRMIFIVRISSVLVLFMFFGLNRDKLI